MQNPKSLWFIAFALADPTATAFCTPVVKRYLTW